MKYRGGRMYRGTYWDLYLLFDAKFEKVSLPCQGFTLFQVVSENCR